MSNIAVITRTSNRPKYFERCYNSVLGQPLIKSYHVIYDNLDDEKYLNSKNLIKHYIDVSKIQYNEPAPKSATPPKLCLHNLYFNYGTYNAIQESWVYHLDDDNFLINNAFMNLSTYLHEDIDLIMLKIYHQGKIMPSEQNFNNHSVSLCDIDTGCFLVKTKIIRNLSWDGWKCSDYRLINKCLEISNKTLWINQIVMRQDHVNNGNRQDYV